MGSDDAAAAVVPRSAAALPPARDERTLAGLIDVLDRADAMLPPRRHRPARSSAYRPAGRRVPAPVRPLPPAPAGRAAAPPPPAPVLPIVAETRGLRASLRSVVRRLAL